MEFGSRQTPGAGSEYWDCRRKSRCRTLSQELIKCPSDSAYSKRCTSTVRRKARLQWTWKPLGPGNVGAAFDKQLAQDRSVASPLVVAIASHRKIGPMRKRGQEIEELSSVRRLHFRPELPLKRGPRFFVVRSFSFFQKLLTGREIGQPNVVKIALGIFRLRQ